MSGHAVATNLLEFTWAAAPQGYYSFMEAPAPLRDHFADNTDATAVQIACHLNTIEVGQSGATTPDVERLLKRQDRLENELDALWEEIEKVANRQRAREQDE